MGRKLIFILVLAVLLMQSSFASIVGISPSIARFHKVLKNGYAEIEAVASTSFEQDIVANLKPEGEISDWITFSPKEDQFVFSREEPYAFTMIVQPPIDTPAGNYTGVLKVTTGELGAVEEGAGSAVIAQVVMLIYVEVVGEEVISCRAGAISIGNTEIDDPFNVKATVWNDGNVRLRPQFQVRVFDQYQTKDLMQSNFLGSQILPTKSKELVSEVNNELPIGQYFAEIYLPQCDVSQRVTFDIVEKGKISDSGNLIGIRSVDKAYANQFVQIMPVFQNLGERKVVAFFKGEIRDLKTDRVITPLESDKITVDPGQTVEFSMYFQPKKGGEYQVSGRVNYNSKITFNEKSKVITVEGETFGFSWVFYLIAYLIIGLLILIMIGKIRKARHRR
ncbi:MAG: hypothetical protein NDI94_05270 [Candidatus Woesearchaeota archaeon]|nr:hypothetical protein [Candidatus Woesearchaeota archaeon]